MVDGRIEGTPVIRVWLWLAPDLRRGPEDRRIDALRQARRASLDTFELVAMAAGLVVVTALTRHDPADAGTAPRLLGVLQSFVLAIPLLAIGLGPFHVRRVRRGLRAWLSAGGMR